MIVNTTRSYSPNRFSHASAIAPLKDGVILAFYSGMAECHDSQRVWLFHVTKEGKVSDPIYIEPLTGNPAFLVHEDKVKLIYSKFEDMSGFRVKWWQHCSLWSRDIDFSNGHITTSAPRSFKVDGKPIEQGYLPRCNPISIDDGYLLPLYREHAPEFHGKIYYSKDGADWEERGEIGRDGMCIQPTIWREGDEIHALLRNFSKSGLRAAWHSVSKDQGKTWSGLNTTKWWNANNSILALNIPGRDGAIIVWNDDPNGRQNITLGTTRGSILARLDGYGSYPAACVANGKLHITWTAKAGALNPVKSVIKHMEFDLKEVEKHV
jgi:hypothetical protein